MHGCPKSHAGFTLIELMIVIAILAILLSVALPVYQDYATRMKITEGLSVAAAAKTATSAACQEDPTLTGLTNSLTGWTPTPDIDTQYITTIVISGECSQPLITITTQNTGTQGYDPIIILTGTFLVGTGKVTWACRSDNTPDHLLPETCRSL